jgi:HlyD family secretion protein
MIKKIPARKGISKSIMALLAIAAAVTVFNLGYASEVRAEAVKRGTITELIELQGKVELDNSEKIYARIEGFIDEADFHEGDMVEAGTRLLQLSVEDLEFAISQAEAVHNASKSQLESLRASIKPEHVKLAEAQLKQAEAVEKAALQDYINNQDSFLKVKVLYENGALSEKDMKDSETLLAAKESSLRIAEQDVEIAQYNLDLLEDGVSGNEIKAVEANVAAAKSHLDELINNKGKSIVCSSIKGIVLTKEADKGQAVYPGSLLCEIGDYDSAYIKAGVLVEDIRKIKDGQKSIISGDVLNDNEIYGEIYYIAPKAESRVSSLGVEQQRIEVRIKFDNSSLKLKPGYTLDIDIAAKEKQGALIIPDKAVFEMDGKDSVFVVSKGKLVLRSIETGIENDDYIEVVTGLTEGELIVVEPDSKLKPGKRVKFKNKS